MSRPKKEISALKKTFIKVYVTEEEKKKIEKQSQKTFLSTSEFCANILLEKSKTAIDKDTFTQYQTIRLYLSQISNNVNQVAKVMNTAYKSAESVSLSESDLTTLVETNKLLTLWERNKNLFL